MEHKNNKKIIAIIIVIITMIVAVVFVINNAKDKKNVVAINEPIISGDIISGDSDSGDVSSENSGDEIYLGPNIFSGDSRPIAVMIDNEKPAWVNHGGLNSAYMLYEFIIEGGETRIMAFFKGVEPTYIGPVRSARHYFLDYAMEHDAIFTHFGWSPLAQSDIKTLGINNINGIYDTFFWRVPPKGSYHNAVTNMENLKKQIDRKKYRDTSENDSIIKYNERDTEIESGEVANTIKIKYSALQNITYAYNPETKTYFRSMRGQAHTDSQTGEQFYAKNIIMIHVKDELLDDPEDKGRRNLYNTGTGKGFYATNGKIEPIVWEKKDRKSKTTYYDLNGKELTINDGITWVQIVPITGTINYEA